MEKMPFFVLKVGRVTEPAATLFDPVDISPDGPPPQCPVCQRALGQMTWQPPYVAVLEPLEREYGDIAAGPYNDYLISERLKSLILQEKVVGTYGLEPVEIRRVRCHGRKLGAPPPYFRMAVLRSQAAVDLRASEVTYESEPICQECRIGTFAGLKRLVIEPNTWKGEDIFIAKGLPGTEITSPRFKQLCEAYEIRNAEFIPAEEFSFKYDY